MLDYDVEDESSETEKLIVRVMGDEILAVFQTPEGTSAVQSLVLSYNQVRQLAVIADAH